MATGVSSWHPEPELPRSPGAVTFPTHPPGLALPLAMQDPRFISALKASGRCSGGGIAIWCGTAECQHCLTPPMPCSPWLLSTAQPGQNIPFWKSCNVTRASWGQNLWWQSCVADRIQEMPHRTVCASSLGLFCLSFAPSSSSHLCRVLPTCPGTPGGWDLPSVVTDGEAGGGIGFFFLRAPTQRDAAARAAHPPCAGFGFGEALS